MCNKKQCFSCENKYPATTEYFAPDKRRSFGVASQCRKCKRAYDREYKKRRRSNPVTNEIEKQRCRDYQSRLRDKNTLGLNIPISYSNCAKCDTIYIVNKKRKNHACPSCEDELKPVNITYRNCIDCGKLESMKLQGTNKWQRCDSCKKEHKKEQRRKKRKSESYKKYRREYKKKTGLNNHRQRARKYGVYYEPVNKTKVFKRDKYKCSVCGCKCNKTNNNPKQATLGHIIPLALGGAHTYSNVRTECRECNVYRGIECDGEQITLFTSL